jgi:hypothetical protein
MNGKKKGFAKQYISIIGLGRNEFYSSTNLMMILGCFCKKRIKKEEADDSLPDFGAIS